MSGKAGSVREFHILNLGAGIQSTCLYLMHADPLFDLTFDYAIFADTQDEPAAVYRHLEWLRNQPGPLVLTGTRGSLKDNLARGVHATGQRFVSIPCYTKAPEDDKEGKTRRQCTREYKTDVVLQILRRQILSLKPKQRVPKDVLIHQYFGISLDEVRRVKKIRARFDGIAWARCHFPLVDLGWSRQGCIRWLKDRVPHPMQRSACVYCPLQNDHEWKAKKEETPEEFETACQVDDLLRTPGAVVNRAMDKPMFLHRSCVPLRQIDFDDLPAQTLDGFTLYDCSGACGN